MASTLTFLRLATRLLNAEGRRELDHLAASTNPPAPDGYLTGRLGVYDEVLTARDTQGELRAFALLQAFGRHDGQYIYIGPFFSRGGAGSALFCEIVRRGFAPSGEHRVFIAAEVQNVFALAAIKSLLPTMSFPRVSPTGLTEAIPAAVQAVAATFAEALSHVGDLDSHRLVTGSSHTLHRDRSTPDGSPVAAWQGWLAARGVDFTRGDSQMIVISGEDHTTRAAVLAELTESRPLASHEPGRRHSAPESVSKGTP